MSRFLAAGTEMNAEDTRLLEAALEQFALTGIRRTSADDIARAAGINRATLYRRLGTRDQIVSAAFLHEARRVLSTIQANLGPADAAASDPENYVVRLLETTLTTLRENRLLRRLLTVDRDETLVALTVGAGPVLHLATEVLAEMLREVRSAAGAGTAAEGRDEDISALSAVLSRFTQSLLLTPDGPLPASSRDELEHLARAVVVPLVLGR